MSEHTFEAPDIPTELDVIANEYAVQDPPRVKFLPWHKPRKQFVRSEQWAVAIEQHLEAFPVLGRPLAYIGLPGDDLLDIRYFAERICTARELPFLYLGLNKNIGPNSTRRTLVDSAAFDLRTQFKIVSELSEVLPDSFASLAEPRSVVSMKVQSIGFFDIVNLDFCDGVARNPPGATEAGNYEAIQQLLGRQLRSRQSWLLFLTTRIGEGHCAEETRLKLAALVASNESACSGFANVIMEMCGASLAEAKAEEQMMIINLCGLLKWLGKMCVSEAGWQMQTLAVDAYTVNEPMPIEDLYSVALRFVPIPSPASDPSGLGSARRQSDDECRIALEVIEKVRNRRNVDHILENDTVTYQRTFLEKCGLLKRAGYDTEAYTEHVVKVWKLPPPEFT